MANKYMTLLRRMARDGSLNPETASYLAQKGAEDAEWREEQHPRGKGGKFAPKGSGSASGSGSSGASGSSGSGSGYTPPSSKKESEEERLNRIAQEYGYRNMQQIRNMNHGTEPPPAESESERKDRLAREYGYRDMKHIQNITHGLEPPPKEPATAAPTIKSGIEYPRTAEKGSGVAGMVRAARITAKGAESMKHRVAEMDSGARFAAKPGSMREGNAFQEGSAFNRPKVGRPSKELTNGTGATKLNGDDLYDQRYPEAKHTINQYLDDNGNLTPEREELHAQSVDNLFSGKKPVEPGQKKTFTMFGGGSAAGKGGLSDPKRCGDFQSSFFTGGTPAKDSVATIDADELKKDIPEYREMLKTDPDNAARYAHEESSAIAKRAMQAAFDNGYNCTLDGTGDGSVEGVRKKIKQARDRGYEVNACYVTCPTELAVERSIARGKKTGRNVPIESVRKIHKAVSQIFPQVASEFDHVALFDTAQGGKPVLIAECQRGGKIKVINQKLYDAFLAKGNE